MKIQEQYPRTIDSRLFMSWRACYRFGDTKVIAEQYNKKAIKEQSKNAKYTTIHRALKYGHCNSVELQCFISSYFRKRIQDEKQLSMKHINNLKN